MGRCNWFEALSLSFSGVSSFLLFSSLQIPGQGSAGGMGGPQGRTGRLCLEGSGGKRGRVATVAGVWTRTFFRPLHELPVSLGALTTAGLRPRLGPASTASGVGPRRAARVPERALPNPSRGRREARGEERRRRGRRGEEEGKGAAAAAGGEEPPRAVAVGGGGSYGGGGGGGAPAGPESGAGTRAAVTPRLPGGRARPLRTKEHVGAEEGPSSGRHEAPGAAGPAPRPRQPGRWAGPLGQPAAVRPAGPGPPHGAARAPAGPHSAAGAAAAAAHAARAAGGRRRRRRRGAAPWLQARRAAPRGRQDGGRRRGQGGVQQPGARAGPAPRHAAQPHGHPVSSLAAGPLPGALSGRAAFSPRNFGEGSCRHPRAFVRIKLQARVLLGWLAWQARISGKASESAPAAPSSSASLRSKSFRVPRRAPRSLGAALLWLRGAT